MDNTVPFLDLKAQYRAIKDEIDAAVGDVFASQQFVLGPAVEAFEREIAAYCGVEHAVGVSSGTDALLLALMTLGIGAGDEVVTTPYTFFATAGSISRLGARPVFVDIEPAGYNIDPARIAAAITPRTRAILPVHLYGRCAEMDAIRAAAGEIPVVEDAAQAIGAEWQGRRAGSLGALGCFSFYPTKNLAGAGEAGLVTTRDPDFAERLRVLRHHGQSRPYHHEIVGGNFRMDALQAAVLSVKLRHLDVWLDARARCADRYRRMFTAEKLAPEPLRLPEPGPSRHAWHQFVIRVPAEHRDKLVAALQERKIGCAVFYPLPLHLQPCFSDLGYQAGDFPESEAAARETVALPMYPELTDDQAQRVVAAVRAYLGS